MYSTQLIEAQFKNVINNQGIICSLKEAYAEEDQWRIKLMLEFNMSQMGKFCQKLIDKTPTTLSNDVSFSVAYSVSGWCSE